MNRRRWCSQCAEKLPYHRHVRADVVPLGTNIVEPTSRGELKRVTTVQERLVNPPGCFAHVHINEQFCYDRGAMVAVT